PSPPAGYAGGLETGAPSYRAAERAGKPAPRVGGEAASNGATGNVAMRPSRWYGRPRAAQKLALMIGSQRNGGELLAAWLSRPIWTPRSTCAVLKMPMLMPRWVPRTSL